MPNTIAELNQYSNTSVVYNDDRDYSITFSAASPSNTSTTIDEDDSFVVPTGIDITSARSQPGNITYTVSSNTVSILGTWPNPLPQGISNTSPGNGVYSITGTFNDVTWNIAKNLVLVAPDRDTDFSFVGNIQYPNPANISQTSSWSWTNSVTIADTNAGLILTTSYDWAEDAPTTFVYTIDDQDPSATYTMTFDQFSGTSGIITVNGVSAGIGNTATITGNRAAVNSANIVFNPYPDATDNVQVYVSASKTNPFGTQVFASNTVVNLNCTSTHAEYSLTTSYGYTEDDTTSMVFDITDTDATATYTVTFDQVSGNTGVFFVNGVSQGIGNAAVLSNSKANINSANVSFLTETDSTGNVGIVYSQVKNTPLYGNITQASNVAISLTNTSSHNKYSLNTEYTYTEDATTDMVFDITDSDPRATNYTVTFDQVSGNTGVFFVNGVNQGIGNTVILSNSQANINSANVSFLPGPDDVGNVGIVYSQVKTNSIFGNTVQASNVAISLTNINSHADYNFATSGTYPEDGFINFGNLISDIDSRATSYSISLQQTSGNVGQWYVNNTPFSNSNVTLNLSNSKANINSANISFLSAVDATANLTFTYNQTKANEVYGNVIQASNVVATYTCISNNEINNMINRSYTSNTVNNIFSTSTPVLDDGVDRGQTYTITLSSSLGKFGTGNIAQITSVPSYSFTGNTTQVNQQFTNMKFVPAPGSASTGTFVYTQARNGVPQVNRTLTLTGTTVAFLSTHSYFTDTIDYVTEQEKYYGSNMQVIVVGGGGGGGCRPTLPYGGGGGAGGNVVIENWGKYPLSSYSIQVGAGGSGSSGTTVVPGVGGQPSRIYGSVTYEVEAIGGGGGSQQGGSSPAGTSVWDGGTYYSSGNIFYGGGGAGSQSHGGNATTSLSGSGGTGYTVPVIGTLVGRGGGGAGTDRVSGTSPSEAGSGGGGGRYPTAGKPGQSGAIFVIWT